MGALTNHTGSKTQSRLLTNRRDVPFILGFRYAFVENVVTHVDFRGNGYAGECLDYQSIPDN